MLGCLASVLWVILRRLFSNSLSLSSVAEILLFREAALSLSLLSNDSLICVFPSLARRRPELKFPVCNSYLKFILLNSVKDVIKAVCGSRVKVALNQIILRFVWEHWELAGATERCWYTHILDTF